MVAEELLLRIKTEVDKAVSDLRRVESQTQSLNKKSGIAFASIAAAAAAVGVALVAMSAKAIDAYKEQEKAESKLSAVLKSTGNQVGLTESALKEYAATLQDLTGVGDETIINAEAVMATFTKVGRDVFPEAIEAALNMSKAFDQDLRSSTIQLGKALQDPIQGVTALRRVGVQLSEQQTEAIKKFVEVGNVAAAQKIILGELRTQVGGVAKAYGETFAGKMDVFNASVGDLEEQFGEFIANGIKPLLEELTPVVKGLTDIMKVINFLTAEQSKNVEVQKRSKELMAATNPVLTLLIETTKGLFNAVSEAADKQAEYNDIIDKSGEVMGNYGRAAEAVNEILSTYNKNMKEWTKKREAEQKKVNDMNTKYIKLYDEMTKTEIELLTEKMNEEIKVAKEIGANTYLIKKYYSEQIEALKNEEVEKEKEREEKEFERKQELNGRIAEMRREGMEAYNQYVLDQTYSTNEAIIENAHETTEELNKDLEERRKKNQKMAETTINTMGDIVAATVEAGIAGENAWEAFGMAAKLAIAKGVKGLAEQWALQAGAAFALGNYVTAAELGAISLAAYAAAAAIPAFAQGGSFTTNGPQLMQVGDNIGGREKVTVEPLSSYGQTEKKMIHITIYMGSNIIYDEVNEGMENGQIIVPVRAIAG